MKWHNGATEPLTAGTVICLAGLTHASRCTATGVQLELAAAGSIAAVSRPRAAAEVGLMSHVRSQVGRSIPQVGEPYITPRHGRDDKGNADSG